MEFVDSVVNTHFMNYKGLSLRQSRPHVMCVQFALGHAVASSNKAIYGNYIYCLDSNKLTANEKAKN